MASRVSIGVIAALTAALAVTLIVGVRRVAELEAGERDLAGDVVRLEDGAALSAAGALVLISADLRRDDDVTFELCTGDAMDPAIWAGTARLEIVLRVADGEESLYDRPLDAAMLEHARHSEDGSCLAFGHGAMQANGVYDVRLTWQERPAFASVRMRARAIVRPTLRAGDGNVVFAVFCLSVLLTLAGAARKAMPPKDLDAAPRALGRVALAVGLALLFMTGVERFVPGGRTTGLVSGLALAGAEIALAFALARAPRADRIAWGRPESLRVAAVGLLVAPVVGYILRLAAIRLLASVPSTGEAPIETFVSLPSGMLSFAIIAVVAPLAEEIFFRGLVFGSLVGSGSRARLTLAFMGAWLLFGVVHLPQTWGNWGGLLAITLAGLTLTVLRAVFRSTLVPALTHLVYNGLLAAMALAGAIVATG